MRPDLWAVYEKRTKRLDPLVVEVIRNGVVDVTLGGENADERADRWIAEQQQDDEDRAHARARDSA